MRVLFSSLLKLRFFHPKTASCIKKLEFFSFFSVEYEKFAFFDDESVDFYSY